MEWTKAENDFETIDRRRILAKLIDSVFLFSGFAQSELIELLRRSETCSFQAGRTILREGEPGDFFYVIIEGSVTITKEVSGRNPQKLATFHAGDSFGEMALIDHNYRSASVQSLSKCMLFRFDAKTFDPLPHIGAKLYRNIAILLGRRLRGANKMVSLLREGASSDESDQ